MKSFQTPIPKLVAGVASELQCCPLVRRSINVLLQLPGESRDFDRSTLCVYLFLVLK